MAAEVYADHWGAKPGFSVCTLRVASVYGPGMRDAGLVPILTGKLMTGQPVSLSGGGLYGSDLVFADDVVAAAIAAMTGDAGGAINIGSGLRTTALQLAAELVDLLHADPELVQVAPAGEAPDRGFSALDVTRAHQVLDYQPTPLRQGLQQYIEYLALRRAAE